MRTRRAIMRIVTGAMLLGLAGQAERQRESTEWSITYWFDANRTKLPRILLIGDSICNGYQSFVRKELRNVAYTSFWATSKCVTDRSYIKELGFVLGEYQYDVIHFNNGLHSLDTDRGEWEAALRQVIAVLRDQGKGAKLVFATSTPLKKPELTEKARQLNAIAVRVMKEEGIPVNDLFGLMDPQDRSMWSDTFHYHQPGRKMQAKQVADVIQKLLPAAAAPAPDKKR